jgi:hypothetical protein
VLGVSRNRSNYDQELGYFVAPSLTGRDGFEEYNTGGVPPCCRPSSRRCPGKALEILYIIQDRERRAKMPVRLNITIDEDLYRRLKKELPSKGISSFIEASVRARLFPDRSVLDAAYRAARKERWRAGVSSDWAATEAEGWPR